MATDDLQRTLGTAQLVVLGAAGVVGTSWIYTNGEFFDSYGAGGEILGLVLAAVLAGGVALAYGELASAMPRAGGEVVYAYAAFGRGAAFVAGWLLIGAYVSSLAFYVTALGTLLTDVVPGMSAVSLWTVAGTPVTLPVLGLGVLLSVVVCALNLRGVRLGAQVQTVLFAGMVLVGAALVVVGFAAGSPDNFLPPFRADADPVGQTVRMVLPGLTFLTGFGLVAILAEDAHAPPHRIRQAVVASLVVAAGFYVLVLLASAWVQPWEETAGTERGTIDAFRAAGFPVLAWGAYAISVGGLLTSFLALFVATSRIMVAMGRGGLLPPVLGRLSGRQRAPRNALLFTLAVTVVLGALGPGAITWFLDTGGVYIGLAWTIGVACLYRLRARRADLGVRRTPALVVLPGLGAAGALGVIAFALYPGTSLSLLWPQEHLILLAWVVLGAVLGVLGVRGRHTSHGSATDGADPLERMLGGPAGEHTET